MAVVLVVSTRFARFVAIGTRIAVIVAALVLSLYMPLFNLSAVVGQ